MPPKRNTEHARIFHGVGSIWLPATPGLDFWRSRATIAARHGFLWAHWDGSRETEDQIAAETKATIRCIPFSRPKEAGRCMVTGRPSEGRVVFAKAY